MSLSIWTGTEERPAAVTLWDGTTEHPAQAAVVPGGAWSVENLLSRPGFTLAQRVGRNDWAEMTPRGATECVLRGVDALEYSFRRTLDGRWFGMHDETMLRTSGVDIDPVTLTWDEVLQYPNLAPPNGDPGFGDQSYALLEELLPPYAPSHVIFVDPKWGIGDPAIMDEFFDLVMGIVPTGRLVAKYSFTGTLLADAATARGLPSWGTMDAVDVTNGNLETYGPSWSMLGLPYSATQAEWDAVLALGKPVIGRLVSTPEQRQIALDKGAVGISCSGVRAIHGAPVI